MIRGIFSRAGIVALCSSCLFQSVWVGEVWSITLVDAVLYSLKEYPGLSAGRNRLLSVKEDIGIATSHHFPMLRLESKYIKTDQPAKVFGLKLNRGELTGSDFAGAPETLNDPSSFDSFVTSINLGVPLFKPRVLISRKAAKRRYLSEHYLYDLEAEVQGKDVVESYIRVLTKRALRAAADSSVKEAREHLKAAKEREKAGVGIYSDVLRAEVFLAQTRDHQVTAANDEQVAIEALRVAMGAPWDYEIIPEGQFTVEGDLPPLETYLEEALAKRKDLLSMEKRVEMAGYGVKFEKGAYIPDLGFAGSYEINGSDSPFENDADNYSVALMFRWNIFDGLVRERKVKKAKFLVDEARYRRKRLENQIRFEVKKAYLDVLEARSRHEIAVKAEKRAEEGLRLVEGRYENSLSRLVELLDTQTALDRARAQRIKAENDYFLSMRELDFSSGKFLEGLGITRNQEEAP